MKSKKCGDNHSLRPFQSYDRILPGKKGAGGTKKISEIALFSFNSLARVTDTESH